MTKEKSQEEIDKEVAQFRKDLGIKGEQKQAKTDFHEDLNKYSSIKHVIGVVSGKGGL